MKFQRKGRILYFDLEMLGCIKFIPNRNIKFSISKYIISKKPNITYEVFETC